MAAGKTLTADDLPKELLGGISEEGDTAHQELVEDDAHGPPVDRLPIALYEDDFWGNVLRSSTHLRGKQQLIALQRPLRQVLRLSRSLVMAHQPGGAGPRTCLSMNSRVSFSM